MESNSNSNYNSLQVTVNKRFSKGLQMLLSYTYSHSIDDYSGTDVSDITRDSRATWSTNRRTMPTRISTGGNASSRATYITFRTSTAAARPSGEKLLNSWSVSGIVTLQSGIPFSIYGEDTLFAATTADLAPGRTLASAIKSGNVADRLNEYFDTTAFASPSAFGDFGQLGRNIIRGPKQIDTDFSIMKSIPITESQRVEFRAEFFNLFNNVNFANPVNVILPRATLGRSRPPPPGPE